MNYWQDLDIEAKITQILADVPEYDPEHHLGRPFLTAYQIAIEFALRFPEDYRRIGKPIGGAGTGQHDSLAQYLALQLSIKIRDGYLPQIEGGFLSNQHLKDIVFENPEGDMDIRSSFDLTC